MLHVTHLSIWAMGSATSQTHGFEPEPQRLDMLPVTGLQEENRLRRERDELLRLERQKHQDYLRRQQQEEEERRRQQGDDTERANMMSQVQGHLDKKVRHHCISMPICCMALRGPLESGRGL